MELIGQMRAAAAALLTRLDDDSSALARRPLDDQHRRWLEYRPRPRPGASIAHLDLDARKAAHRLLATGLSPHAHAQAVTVMALEEVLDRQEGGHRERRGDDYWVVVYGDPADDVWAWRFEGHHLSVTMTVAHGQIHPTPVFLGANPAAVRHAGRDVIRPLAAEELLARAVLEAMDAQARAAAVVSDTAPADIRSGPRPLVEETFEPLGVPGGSLPTSARARLGELVEWYLGRLPDDLATREAERADPGRLHFAWEGPTEPGRGHYYRVQGPDLLIEYDNTADNANHAHTVIRRPRSEFGGDVLAAHLAGTDH
jgi:hypothetical protein